MNISNCLGLALLNVMRLPLAIMPVAHSSYKEAVKSHERVKAYLNSPEAKPPLISDAVDNTLVDIQNASFSWNESSTSETMNVLNESLVGKKESNDAVLHDISLQIRKGEFIALVGEVGSGKVSSLWCQSNV